MGASMRAAGPVLLVVSALLAAGCGDDKKDAAKTTSTATTTATTATPPVQADTAPSGAPGGATPAAAVHTYLDSLSKLDGATACGVLSTHAQAEAIDLAQRPGKPPLKNCGAALLLSIGGVKRADLKKLRNVPIAKSEIKGDTATLRPKGATQDVGLRKIGGRWYIISTNA
jgi:hypothetical protein